MIRAIMMPLFFIIIGSASADVDFTATVSNSSDKDLKVAIVGNTYSDVNSYGVSQNADGTYHINKGEKLELSITSFTPTEEMGTHDMLRISSSDSDEAEVTEVLGSVSEM